MNRRWSGVVARIGKETIDGRLLDWPTSPLLQRLRVTPVLEQLTDLSQDDGGLMSRVGAVSSLAVDGTGLVIGSGYLATTCLGRVVRGELERGARVMAGVGLSTSKVEMAWEQGWVRMTDWTVDHLVIGAGYKSAWDLPCWIQLDGR